MHQSAVSQHSLLFQHALKKIRKQKKSHIWPTFHPLTISSLPNAAIRANASLPGYHDISARRSLMSLDTKHADLPRGMKPSVQYRVPIGILGDVFVYFDCSRSSSPIHLSDPLDPVLSEPRGHLAEHHCFVFVAQHVFRDHDLKI